MVSRTLEETKNFAQKYLAKLLAEKEVDTPMVVLLYGDLGAGKTTFVQMLGRELGIEEQITSPTFLIRRKHEISHPVFKKLIHVDAYRLSSGEEIEKLRFREDLEDNEALICIEWPEHIKEILPENAKKLSFRFVDENTREIKE